MPDEAEKLGMRLLEKGHRGLVRLVFSRTGLVLLLLLLNVALFFTGFFWFREILPGLYVFNAVLSLLLLLCLINSGLDPNAKITWLVLIMLMPTFGALLYAFSLSDWGHRAMSKRWKLVSSGSGTVLEQDKNTLDGMRQSDPGSAALAAYVASTGCYPAFNNTSVRYFPSGEEKYRALLEQLEKAEKFIFLEYFIVDEGIMWGNILDILVRKAAQGVDVRLLYDGTCEFLLLPRSYPRQLGDLGIQCRVFSPVTPFVSTHYNFRDHRKILVIDGQIAFTGGINLADEYINKIKRFGHWKDTAIMLTGEAVRSFTLMFLQMWHLGDKKYEHSDYVNLPVRVPEDAAGYVLPYGDSPVDDERVGRQVYLDILNRAESYVHIMTPYLILDTELENALKYAGKRGVDVRLILPGIPDKRLPNALAKTHYRSLMESGVKIFEYSPGFIHAKSFVSDDRRAVVGTINLDYRSLSHHFECAAYMLDCPCIADIEADFQATEKLCSPVTAESIKREKLWIKIVGVLLKVISPLM